MSKDKDFTAHLVKYISSKLHIIRMEKKNYVPRGDLSMSFLFNKKPLSLDTVMRFVGSALDYYLQVGTQDASSDQIRDWINRCNDGSGQSRRELKQVILKLLERGNSQIISELPADFKLGKSDIDRIIDWSNPDMLNSYYLFLAILQHYQKIYTASTLGYLIDKYQLNRLRIRGSEGAGFYVDQQDVRAMWENEALHLDYKAKMEVLVQIIYERLYGAGCIDEMLHQNIGDISVGVSGMHNARAVHEVNMPVSMGCWVNYQGCPIHFLFPQFFSENEITLVGNRLINASVQGLQKEKPGLRTAYGVDGSKRMIATASFGEGSAIWIYKATEQSSISDSLYGEIENYQILQQIEAALVKGGLTIPVCGARGAGKTWKLESLVQHVQNFYAIRVLEMERELHLHEKYPFKNIYSIQTNESSVIPEEMAWNFALRSDGDVFVIGDTLSDRMVCNIAKSANRVGRNFLFTFLAKTPDLVIPEIANTMLREHIYSNLQDATAAALSFVRCCIFVSQDIESGQHIYEIFEFVVEETCLWMYSIHPLVTYDRGENRYRMDQSISQDLYKSLRYNTPLTLEREALDQLYAVMSK